MTITIKASTHDFDSAARTISAEERNFDEEVYTGRCAHLNPSDADAAKFGIEYGFCAFDIQSVDYSRVLRAMLAHYGENPHHRVSSLKERRAERRGAQCTPGHKHAGMVCQGLDACAARSHI